MGTAIVLLILAVLTSLSVRKIILDKKNGKTCQCGGNCGRCGGGCH